MTRKGREKKESDRSRRRSKKNVKSTDTHRGVLEALEESTEYLIGGLPSSPSPSSFFSFLFLPFDRRRTDRTGQGDGVWKPRGERQKVEIMSSQNGPDATYASVQEKIIEFARCPTLSTIVPRPLCLHPLTEESSRRTTRDDDKVKGNWEPWNSRQRIYNVS